VVKDKDTLVGLVTQTDLLQASPSPATSLSVWEINFLLAKMQVRDAMTTQVVVVDEKCPLEEAALVMAEHKFGCLPVVRGKRLVGIITETDLFLIFLELLGAREVGVRLTMLVPEEKGILASLTSEIAQMGGNIVALSTFRGEDPTNRMVTAKVSDAPTDKLVAIMEALGMEIVDVREG
jgi:acetoin utilization protein AcuB